MADDDAVKPFGCTNPTSTSIICRSFDFDGMTFSWWAVGESPALVTVSSQGFSRQSAFTHNDVETFAK